jgi:hypothetical protein
VLGQRAYVCQVCELYIPVKSNITIADIFTDSKKVAEEKIREREEAFALNDIDLSEDVDLTIDEFEEEDDNLPLKFEKRKAGKATNEDSEEYGDMICPFCDEIFDDATSHLTSCELAPEDATIEDILPEMKKKKKRKKRTRSASAGTTRGKAGPQEKKKCPYCGKEFVRLGRHLNSCKKKPKDEEPKKE